MKKFKKIIILAGLSALAVSYENIKSSAVDTVNIDFVTNTQALGKITVKILDLAIDLGVSAIKLIWGAYQEIYDKWGIAGILASLVIPGGILTLKFITEFSASIDDSKYVKKAKDGIENIKIYSQIKKIFIELI